MLKKINTIPIAFTSSILSLQILITIIVAIATLSEITSSWERFLFLFFAFGLIPFSIGISFLALKNNRVLLLLEKITPLLIVNTLLMIATVLIYKLNLTTLEFSLLIICFEIFFSILVFVKKSNLFFPKYLLQFICLVLFAVSGYFFLFKNYDFHLVALKGFFPIIFISFLLAVIFFQLDKFFLKVNPLIQKIILAIVALFIALINFLPTLPYDPHHYNFYLGPIINLDNGGTALIDTYSQYGVLVLYFMLVILKLTHLGINYTGLALLTTFFQTAILVGFFYFCYRLYKSIIVSTLIVTLATLVSFYLTLGFVTYYPSVGFYRFGIVYILTIVFSLFWKKLQGYGGIFLLAMFLALSFLWSFDSFTHVFYVSIIIFLILATQKFLFEKKSIFPFLANSFLISLTFFLPISTFMAIIAISQNQSLNFSPYINFLGSYANGFGLILTPGIGLWWIFLALYLHSAVWSFIEYIRQKDKYSITILLVSACGIAISPYYINRSHPNNLLHIALPLFFLLGFWLIKFSQSGNYRKLVVVICLVFLNVFLYQENKDLIASKFPATAAGVLISSKQFSINTLLSSIKTVSEDEQKTFGKVIPVLDEVPGRPKNFAALLSKDFQTGALAQKGLGNIATVSDPDEDQLIWEDAKKIIAKNITQSADNGYLVVTKDFCTIDYRQIEIYDLFIKNVQFKELSDDGKNILYKIGTGSGYFVLAHQNKMLVIKSISPTYIDKSLAKNYYYEFLVKGENFSPTTEGRILDSHYKTEYISPNEIKVYIHQTNFNNKGIYQFFISNCQGVSNSIAIYNN